MDQMTRTQKMRVAALPSTQPHQWSPVPQSHIVISASQATGRRPVAVSFISHYAVRP